MQHFDILPLGAVILAVHNTGDLLSRATSAKKKSAELIKQIYEKASSVPVLMPPMLAFILDREGLSEQDITDLGRTGMKFIPRREFENYLISPDALAACLNTLPSFTENPVTAQSVSDWLTNHAADADYGASAVWSNDLRGEPWLSNVRAAKLLTNLFAGLSENKERYDKIQHGVQLTDWLLKNSPNYFAGLKTFLTEALTRQN